MGPRIRERNPVTVDIAPCLTRRRILEEVGLSSEVVAGLSRNERRNLESWPGEVDGHPITGRPLEVYNY